MLIFGIADQSLHKQVRNTNLVGTLTLWSRPPGASKLPVSFRPKLAAVHAQWHLNWHNGTVASNRYLGQFGDTGGDLPAKYRPVPARATRTDI